MLPPRTPSTNNTQTVDAVRIMENKSVNVFVFHVRSVLWFRLHAFAAIFHVAVERSIAQCVNDVRRRAVAVDKFN